MGGGATDNHHIRHRTAIVGGGASGILVALHLARTTGPQHVLIFETRSELGAGCAYSTNNPDHLLNVPARCMSAFGDVPDDFVQWMVAHEIPSGPDQFMARRLYRRYLQDRLHDASRRAPATLITWIREQVRDLRVDDRTEGVAVVLDAGRTIAVDDAVLAVGAPQSSVLSGLGLSPAPEVVLDPWSSGALEGLPRDQDVLVVGSGLTMVDVALVLGRKLRKGCIQVRSRHGLLPAVHTRSGFAEFDALDLSGVKDARTLLHRIRETARQAERQGSDWRNVVSAMRSRTPAVWAQLPLAERSRLLRHAERHWEIHRHRISPTVARSLDSMIGAGRLNVGPGRVERVVPIGEHGRGQFDVTITSGDHREILRVGALVDATGPSSVVTSSPLLHSLVTNGVAKRDPLGLGVEVDECGSLVTSNGRIETHITTIGWNRRGALFESTAIPELRDQAAGIASSLASRRPDRSLDSQHGSPLRLVGAGAS